MEFEPTEQDLRDIHEQAVIIEDMFKDHADKIRDEFGVKIAINVFMNAGISSIALGLALIKDDEVERVTALLRVIMSIVEATQIVLTEHQAQEIIKKVMEKK